MDITRSLVRGAGLRTALAVALALSLVTPAVAVGPAAVDDDTFSAAPLLVASPQTGALGAADGGDLRDRYAVSLAEDEVLDLALTGPTGTDFDLTLYAPGVSLDETRSEFYVIARADSPDTASESISYLVPPGAAGQYFVEVQAFAGASGNYSLSWSVASSAGRAVRISGSDRYETAAAVSRSTFATATTAVVASGANWPDALSAAGLAGAVSGPVLLVPPTAAGDDARLATTITEIERLGVVRLYVIGGDAAVSDGVFGQLESRVVTIERIEGATRYETAAKVAAEIKDVTSATPADAFVVRGDAYADALAVSPFAFSEALPVLLTRPASLDPFAAAFIEANDITDVVIAGGEAAVGANVLDAVEALNGGATDVERASGADRYETAADVAGRGVARGWGSWDRMGVATGQNFPDALSGGAAMGVRGGVLLLTRSAELSPAAADAIGSAPTLGPTALVFGGLAAVSEPVRTQIEALLP